MTYPKPDDLGNAPVWDIYILAQAVQASLGQIPSHTLAFGVEVDGLRVCLIFRLSEISGTDDDDISDIVSEFEGLVGSHVVVRLSREIGDRPKVSPQESAWWIFIAREADD